MPSNSFKINKTALQQQLLRRYEVMKEEKLKQNGDNAKNEFKNEKSLKMVNIFI